MSESLRPRKRHEMKCWPEFFEPTLQDILRFILCLDDRPEGYQVGDELLLKEWDPEINPYGPGKYKGFTGREVLVRVDYVMPVETVDRLMDLEIPYPAEHVIMSISRVH